MDDFKKGKIDNCSFRDIDEKVSTFPVSRLQVAKFSVIIVLNTTLFGQYYSTPVLVDGKV